MSHVDIMTALFDQDTVTRDLIASKEARKEKDTNLKAIKSIMTDFNVSLTRAMDTLKIPDPDREYYIQQIEGKKES